MNLSNESSLKELLGEIAVAVEGLPENLKPSAFSTLLSFRLQGASFAQKKIDAKGSPAATIATGESVGEYLAGFKADLKEDEKLLAAINFTQKASEDNSSTIEIAHTALKDIGIKLSNAGVFGKQLLKKKWVFAVGKAGNKAMKLRISTDGIAALDQLMSQQASN
jgi:hypothetical protein